MTVLNQSIFSLLSFLLKIWWLWYAVQCDFLLIVSILTDQIKVDYTCLSLQYFPIVNCVWGDNKSVFLPSLQTCKVCKHKWKKVLGVCNHHDFIHSQFLFSFACIPQKKHGLFLVFILALLSYSLFTCWLSRLILFIVL